MKPFVHTMLLMLAPFFIYAGDIDRTTNDDVLYLPQGYRYNALSGYGYSNHFNGAGSNLPEINPASIYSFKKIFIDLGYQFNGKTDLTGDSGINRSGEQYNSQIPQSAGLIVPFGQLNIGIGFSQRYNLKSVAGPSEIILFSPEYPAGVDTSFYAINKAIASAYCLAASYSFRNLFFQSDILSVGANLSYNSIQSTAEIFGTSQSFNFKGYLWSLGLIYQCNKNLFFGLYYENGDKFKKKVNVEPPTLYYFSKFQDKLHFGFQIQANESLGFYSNISRIFWNDKYVEDNFEYAMGLVYKPLNILSTSIGFFTKDLKYKNENPSPLSSDNSSNAFFLTGGLQYLVNQLQFDLVVADSHLFSSDLRKQTVYKLSVGYYLNSL